MKLRSVGSEEKKRDGVSCVERCTINCMLQTVASVEEERKGTSAITNLLRKQDEKYNSSSI